MIKVIDFSMLTTLTDEQHAMLDSALQLQRIESLRVPNCVLIVLPSSKKTLPAENESDPQLRYYNREVGEMGCVSQTPILENSQ